MAKIVHGRKVTLAELRQLAADACERLQDAAQSVGREIKLYLHWSAGHYNQHYDDYHISIDNNGDIFVTTDDLAEVLAHTYRRNTGAVGISLACGAFCTSNDLGSEPPTKAQIESMAHVVAMLADVLGIPIDIQHVMTHGEAADNEDGITDLHDQYGPKTTCERWDLEFLQTSESPLFNPNAEDGSRGGDVLRGKAIWYQQQWEKEGE